MTSSKVYGILMFLGPLDLYFFKGPKNLGISWLYGSSFICFLNFSFQNFFLSFFFSENFSLFFFWKFHFIKSYLIFFFFENFSSLQKTCFSFFEFFWSSPLARTHCSLPLKVHEILIFLGLGKQQRGPRLGSFILGFEGCWVFSP